jgi:hypothetical protein
LKTESAIPLLLLVDIMPGFARNFVEKLQATAFSFQKGNCIIGVNVSIIVKKGVKIQKRAVLKVFW